MSETILVAGITCIAGLGGAVFGLLSGIIAAKIGAKAQIEQTIIQEYFKRRASAFDAVLLAEKDLSLNGRDEAAIEKFSSAVDVACLSASPENALEIMRFKDAVIEQPSNLELIKGTKAEAIMAMQMDLAVFTRPKIIKNRWRVKRKRRKRR